jgi:hypothetical protein
MLVRTGEARTKTMFWLQRSQMFIDLGANHFLALLRSAMYGVDEYDEP